MSARVVRPDDVAVVVACRNESRHLGACVESVLAASRGRARIVFVDDASTDDSPAILRAFADRIEVLAAAGEGPGRARNLAWRKVDRPYVAFLDADAKVPADWLDRLAAGLDGQPETVSSVGGLQEAYDPGDAREVYFAGLLADLGFVSDYVHRGVARPVLHNPTCNVLYDRRALAAAGGFDETFWPCEDLDLDLRLRDLGWTARYSPDIAVRHQRPVRPSQLYRMMRRYGFGHARLVRKHGPCQPLHALPVAFAAALFAHARWLFERPVTLLKMDALLCLALSMLLWSRTRRFSKTARYFADTFAMIVSWNFGFFMGVFSRTGRARPRG